MRFLYILNNVYTLQNAIWSWRYKKYCYMCSRIYNIILKSLKVKYQLDTKDYFIFGYSQYLH